MACCEGRGNRKNARVRAECPWPLRWACDDFLPLAVGPVRVHLSLVISFLLQFSEKTKRDDPMMCR